MNGCLADPLRGCPRWSLNAADRAARIPRGCLPRPHPPCSPRTALMTTQNHPTTDTQHFTERGFKNSPITYSLPPSERRRLRVCKEGCLKAKRSAPLASGHLGAPTSAPPRTALPAGPAAGQAPRARAHTAPCSGAHMARRPRAVDHRASWAEPPEEEWV